MDGVRPEKLLRRKIEDTYEAAYYLTFGAHITGAYVRRVARNKITKKGFSNQWIVEMDDIPETQVYIWKQGYPLANARELADARKKVKRAVKRFLRG